MLKKFFDKTVTDRKDAISIHTLISQICTTKTHDKHFISKSGDGKLRLKSFKLLEIYTHNWKDSLPNILQKQILSKSKYGNIFYKKNNITINKKLATPLNKNLPTTLYKRSVIIPLTVNMSQNYYTFYLLLSIFNNILSNHKIF